MYELWEMMDDDIIITHPLSPASGISWKSYEEVNVQPADWDTRKSSLEEKRYTEERTLFLWNTFLSALPSPTLIDSYRFRSDDKRARRVFKSSLEGHLRGPYITGIRARVRDSRTEKFREFGESRRLRASSLVIMRVASVSPQISNLALGMSPISYDIGAN